MKINVSGSGKLWQAEFYSHENVRFSSFKHGNNNRRNYVQITFLGTNFQNLKQTWECCISNVTFPGIILQTLKQTHPKSSGILVIWHICCLTSTFASNVEL